LGSFSHFRMRRRRRDCSAARAIGFVFAFSRAATAARLSGGARHWVRFRVFACGGGAIVGRRAPLGSFFSFRVLVLLRGAPWRSPSFQSGGTGGARYLEQARCAIQVTGAQRATSDRRLQPFRQEGNSF
jgi:hypothetical protein